MTGTAEEVDLHIPPVADHEHCPEVWEELMAWADAGLAREAS